MEQSPLLVRLVPEVAEVGSAETVVTVILFHQE